MSWRIAVRTTVTIDDELLAKAEKYTGLKERTALLNKALKTLVEVEAGGRLALLGGSSPRAKLPLRRRPSAA
jgi:Arc/MetJ family transcription regulator